MSINVVKVTPFNLRHFRVEVMGLDVGSFAAVFGVSCTSVEQWEAEPSMRPPKALRMLAGIIAGSPSEARGFVISLARRATPREFERALSHMVLSFRPAAQGTTVETGGDDTP